MKDLAIRATMTLLLALVTTTATARGNKEYEKSQAPIGCLDLVEMHPGVVRVAGWTCDPYLYVFVYGELFFSGDDKLYVLNDNDLDNFGWFTASFLQTPVHKAKQNQVEIHFQQDGTDKYVFTYDMNRKRPDAQEYVYRENDINPKIRRSFFNA